MTKLWKSAQVYFYELNPVLPLAPTVAPLSSPFPISLSTGETINLALINIPASTKPIGILLTAVVNWSATFTPPSTSTTLSTPGYADATFELLRNGVIINRLTQTVVQKGTPLSTSLDFAIAVPTYELMALSFVDLSLLLCHTNTYTLRVTNLALVDPVVASGTATTTAQVGSISLVGRSFKPINKSVFSTT